ncbi:spermidine/putrescine ABC transporter substrate-binding protein [Rhizobium sp. S96]|uniref:polyamine ABC transporter substrate-binding protein n=1 Tax=Rhizobium sp. S96 TaxID=3055140 RepID=UPI0025AA65B7|nr:spermidine/putrescine ABC transporter substrate-binding protein [Rhizobium sp. S96]MDM9624081.1 spermidine/putrescine ABC transporter substrate-binding protein [Rhizobium sp. S96]
MSGKTKAVLRSASTKALAISVILGSVNVAGAADLVISNWDGYMAKDVAQSFKAATGLEIEVVNHATNEEIMGKLMAGKGKGYDVVFVSSPFAEILNGQGMLAPLDKSAIPNLANLYPEAAQLAYDPGNAYSVPYTWGATGLCYRSDLVKTPVDSWNTLLKPDDALKGKTTMLATDRWLMAAGLLSLGYSVNEKDAGKIAQAKDKLIEAKKTLLAYDDTTFYSKLVSGEAHLVQAWDGWCNYGITDNKDIKFVVPKEGSDLWVDTIVVMKNSEKQAEAMKFINFMLDAKNHAWAAENILYKVPNKAAMESLDPKLIAQYPNMGTTPVELMKYELLRDLGATQKDYSRAVSEIKAAN